MKKKIFPIMLVLFSIFFTTITTVNAWFIPNRTSLGYTISLVDGNIIKIYDNMQEKNTKDITMLLAKKMKTNNYDTKTLSLKMGNQVYEKYRNEKVEEYLLTPYYDLDKDRLSFVGVYDIEFTDGTFGSIIIEELID